MKLPFALLLATCATLSHAQADPFAPVAWMAGCWTQTGREAGSVEQWMAPAGGLMLGMARIVKGGRVIEFEFMQLRADAEGRLSFIAQPQGRPPTEFKLARQAEAQAVFENTAHDFPQRVSYRRMAPDQLVARIEGERNGKVRGIDFAMQRTACP
ncbi:DUF6265 family protein [Roseateles asaccharophilus]|uniref:DUF6265 domain-containing protein n=1 Tax=Roseateles asaccharophilus TaxID=582607 RepID=A0ABU2A6M9_9BURK|nr:DUF6265 family protein [Roseateles asaccharophilus]MDR7332850.1 hypothetical protein [Roseateles asaccharophilus]